MEKSPILNDPYQEPDLCFPTPKKAEATLRIEIDEEAFDRLYGFTSHPFPVSKGQQVAVRVVSQFGEESMKVLAI